MDRPRVTVHNTVSLDGQLTGFPVDLGLHYEIAGSIPHDAVLTGSGTLLAAARAEGVDLSGEDPDEPAPAAATDDERTSSTGNCWRPVWSTRSTSSSRRIWPVPPEPTRSIWSTVWSARGAVWSSSTCGSCATATCGCGTPSPRRDDRPPRGAGGQPWPCSPCGSACRAW